MTERLHFHFSLSCIGEGSGNALQCSCLENPRDGGAWWATVYGVAQSQTRLKQLSSSSSSNIGVPQYIMQMLRTTKEEIDSNTIIMGDFNHPLAPMNRSSRKKINKETKI